MEERVEITVSTGALHGTLLVPEGGESVPVMLMVAGSGPTDRDGNSPLMKGKNNCTRMLAEKLLKGGIATLRYDKRGVGESKEARGDDDKNVFEDVVHDAETWIGLLKSDGRFGSIIVAGHSEGSLIGMLAARSAGADGYVSIEGAGRPIDQVLVEQFKRQPAFLRKPNARILEALRRGETVERMNFLLKKLYRPEVQPYLRSWLAYDPAEEMEKLDISVLIVQGGRDIQTSANDFNALKAARPDATILYLEEMNHVLKACGPGTRQNIATYTNPELPLAPGLVGGVAEFVLDIHRAHAARS